MGFSATPMPISRKLGERMLSREGMSLIQAAMTFWGSWYMPAMFSAAVS